MFLGHCFSEFVGWQPLLVLWKKKLIWDMNEVFTWSISAVQNWKLVKEIWKSDLSLEKCVLEILKNQKR